MTQSAPGRPPFRADHVGSLLRPAALKQAHREHAAGRLDDATFAGIQDAAIREVVALQENAGLQVVTDGEFRRGSYWGRFVERLSGFVIRTAEFRFRDDSGHELEFTAPYAAARVERTGPLAADEFAALAPLTKATPKITIPAPSTMHFYRCGDFADSSVYPDEAQFFADLGRAFREEVRALADAGCRYIQLDEVAVAMLGDPLVRERTRALGRDPDALVDIYVDLINEAVSAAPEATFAIHMCRGNFKGHYLADGGYESVAERFFQRANVRSFLLEYDTARAGDFSPLRHVPANKGVVAGIVSSKTAALENADDLVRRLEEASAFIDMDRLAIGPQCGFASTVAGNPLQEADEVAKLELLVSVARRVWGTAG